MKRAEMILHHVREWPTIGRDLTDASTNGLAKAAKAGKRGWHEADALAWARANRRLEKAVAAPDWSLSKTHRAMG
jgi:hypothetical protein